MKITLIKPNIGRREHSLYVDNASMEPLQLGILAALTPEDIEVVMYDDRLEPIPYEEKTDLVAITVETFTARRSYEIADEYRKRGVKVIMGGIHIKLLPEEAIEHADSIMIGRTGLWWAAAYGKSVSLARFGSFRKRAVTGITKSCICSRSASYCAGSGSCSGFRYQMAQFCCSRISSVILRKHSGKSVGWQVK